MSTGQFHRPRGDKAVRGEVLEYAAVGLTFAGLGALAGAPLAVGLAIGAAGTAADVSSNLIRGNRRGAIIAGVFGILGARTGRAVEVARGRPSRRW